MEQIIVNDVLINGGRIEYKVTATKHIANAFHKPFSYWVEYDQNMESVPQSIAVIPFLCDILPIIWVADVELVVPELDEDYYNSIDVTRNAYINMYPNISFKGKITCGKIIKNEKSFTNSKKKATAFFSGGVDSWATLVSNIDDYDLDLVTIWGSDIKLDDEESWEKVKSNTAEVAKSLNLGARFIKSTFKDSLNYEFLDNLIAGKVRNNSWWYFIQHGIALIGHVAPYVYVNNIDTHFIPATAAASNQEKLASYKTIDETVKLAWCDVIHDQFEFSRIERLEKAVEWHKKTGLPVKFRVCYNDNANGDNCCACEKCFRTMLELLLLDCSPNDFGFDFCEDTVGKMQLYVYENHQKIFGDKNSNRYFYYTDIINGALRNEEKLKQSGRWKYLEWITRSKDRNTLAELKYVKTYRIKTKLYSLLHR